MKMENFLQAIANHWIVCILIMIFIISLVEVIIDGIANIKKAKNK